MRSVVMGFSGSCVLASCSHARLPIDRPVSRISGGSLAGLALRAPAVTSPGRTLLLMAGTWERTRARARIETLAAAAHEERNMRRQVLWALRQVIDFDAY